MSTPEETATLLREWSRHHQRKAHELAMLAFKIEEPPEGVRVETRFNGTTGEVTATFYGPTVDMHQAV